MTTTNKWKPSAFNILLPHEESYIFFNSVSSMLLSLTEEQYQLIATFLEQLENGGTLRNSTLQDVLASHSFIVPYELDEYEREHRKFLAQKEGAEHVLFTIAPTMGCNLSCSYCFQRNIDKIGVMSSEVQQGLVEFFAGMAKNCKKIGVQWFGGEPLLALPVIEALTSEFKKICACYQVMYHADMITNGILLSPDVIKRLEALSLEAVQVTLDGLPGTFSRRKGISLTRSRAYYEFLLKNMTNILNRVGSLTVRINVDKDNYEEAKTIVRWFKENSVTDARIDFRLGFLTAGKGGLDCIPHTCFSHSEFKKAELEFKHFLAKEGFVVYGFPVPLSYTCIAQKKYAYTIDPLGRIGKCVPEMGQPNTTYARIRPDNIKISTEEANSGAAPYQDFDPFTATNCKYCNLLPVCLGQCPRLQALEPKYCEMKKGLADKLAVYDNYQRQF